MIKIYSGAHCAACDAAVVLCETNNLQYQKLDISGMSPLQWRDKIGFIPRSVPQIFSDDTYLGGLKEFKTYVEEK